MRADEVSCRQKQRLSEKDISDPGGSQGALPASGGLLRLNYFRFLLSYNRIDKQTAFSRHIPDGMLP